MDKANQNDVDGVFSNKRNNVQPVPPVASAPDADVYKKNPRKGIALIFNHKNFSIPDLTERKGTDKDRDDLKNVLNDLKFDVRVFDDLTYDEIVEVLLVVSRMDHADHDCLMITIMSHGDEGILFAKDRPYPTKKLWSFFSSLHCRSLAGKPKLFFIQACRGSNTDPGTVVSFKAVTDSDKEEKVYSIPVVADILIMYSTVEGYYSWRDPAKGSYFIQALVNQLRDGYRTKDLLSILTSVNREVATGFTSVNPYDPSFNGKKEMCSIVSMLTRNFYLH